MMIAGSHMSAAPATAQLQYEPQPELGVPPAGAAAGERISLSAHARLAAPTLQTMRADIAADRRRTADDVAALSRVILP